ncbi:DUF4255 domain-containing protein [Cognatishimia sp. MH4019]|uniref:DUF4255 domain-containing protein n=1 Tax=Cognatishimia sp. MH4019 TaxID=2854030 RepID=UPI001CD36F60
MSGYNVILDISRELRQQIVTSLQTAPNDTFELSGTDAITLRPPVEGLPDGLVASLFLYHIEIDGGLRNQMPLPDRTNPNRSFKPPLPVSLSYMFTPLGTGEETNQSIIGRILQHFHDYPTLSTLEGTPVGDSRGAAAPELRVRHDVMAMDQLTNIWSAFSQPFRLSIGFEVEVVAVDSGLPPRITPRVDEMVRAVGKVGA